MKPADYVETRQKASLDVYRPFFAAARERFKACGLLVLHLGDSKKCNMGLELAKRVGQSFEVADCFTESVEHCESHGSGTKEA